MLFRSSRLTQPWKIEKTPQVLQRLLFQLGDRGLSPSTLSTYLNDPAEFYVRFVLGIREEEAVEERMAANIRGKVLHDVHEMLFKHFQKEQVWALDRVYDAVEAGIQKHFPGPRKTGPFVIERNVLHKMALDWATAEGNRIVNDEDRDSPWHIHLVEEKLETFLVINDEHVKVQGRADRIEAWNNGWAVVDLKSGGFQKSELSVSTLEDLRKPSKGKALQLFTYAWLLSKYQAGGPFRAGIHAMRKPQDAVAWLSFQRSEWIERETLDAFEHDVLGPIIAEMLDTSIPFRAADFEEEEG